MSNPYDILQDQVDYSYKFEPMDTTTSEEVTYIKLCFIQGGSVILDLGGVSDLPKSNFPSRIEIKWQAQWCNKTPDFCGIILTCKLNCWKLESKIRQCKLIDYTQVSSLQRIIL